MATRTIGDIQKSNGNALPGDSISLTQADTRQSGQGIEKNELNELGQKIFLDRYAVKDAKKRTLAVDDLVIVIVDDKSGQREIGTVIAYDPTASGGAGKVSVELKDGVVVERMTEHVSKPIETSPEQMMERVARGIAAIEGEKADEWYENFRWLLNGWKFVPAGRILTAAGTDQQLTFYNCYVVPSPKDSRIGIVDTLSQMMEIMSRGGGVGINISSLRPRHSYVKGVNGRSSGSVSWGALYSFVTGLIEQGGSRRGALMLILNCWHPDVLEFINAKRDMGKINNANVSVGITDKFMEAVRADADWDLVFPDSSTPDFERLWDGNLDKWINAGHPVITYKTVKARDVWNSITESAWASAEPGVFFIDRANKDSNSWYYDAGYLSCTNPCGEQPIPGWAVCNLGAINLSKFVCDGEVTWDELGKAVRYSVRFLDNVIDATPYFFEENYRQQKNERRVGLNTMGLAEMMIRLGIRYGSEESTRFIDRLYRFISSNAYQASAEIAAEKGAFPEFDAEKFLQSGYMQRMPEDVRQTVREKGIRNVTLLTQAPNGTIGTMVGTSTGIEPFYFWSYFRKSRLGQHEERVKVLEEWQQAHPGETLPDYFVTAMDLTPKEHVQVQAAIQRWVDSAISKTCNLPSSYTVEQTRELYELMYKLGCKGGTIYRDGSRDVQVLNLKEEDKKVSEQTEKVETPTPSTVQEQSGTTESQPVTAVQPALFTQLDGGTKPKIRPRPYKRRGYTVSKNTPSGTAHITMNEDEEGQPFEVFVEIGKAGSDIKAMAEAMGRLMSLLLRIESPISPTERVQEIVKQITGIGGARSYGFGKRRVLSLPDAVGQALAENFLGVTTGTEQDNQGSEMGVSAALALLEEGGNAEAAQAIANSEIAKKLLTKAASGAAADICPNCGDSAFIRVEGCQTCYACGYSEC
jgi:ribonucleoside-diphosphate reductase alpha chain